MRVNDLNSYCPSFGVQGIDQATNCKVMEISSFEITKGISAGFVRFHCQVSTGVNRLLITGWPGLDNDEPH